MLNTEKFKMRAKELKSAVQKDLEEATLDAAGVKDCSWRVSCNDVMAFHIRPPPPHEDKK